LGPPCISPKLLQTCNESINHYFFVHLKLDQRLSLPHIGMTIKKKEVELIHKTDEQINPVNSLESWDQFDRQKQTKVEDKIFWKGRFWAQSETVKKWWNVIAILLRFHYFPLSLTSPSCTLATGKICVAWVGHILDGCKLVLLVSGPHVVVSVQALFAKCDTTRRETELKLQRARAAIPSTAWDYYRTLPCQHAQITQSLQLSVLSRMCELNLTEVTQALSQTVEHRLSTDHSSPGVMSKGNALLKSRIGTHWNALERIGTHWDGGVPTVTVFKNAL